MRIRLRDDATLSLNRDGAVSAARRIYHVNEIGDTPLADVLRAVREAAPQYIEASERGTVDIVDRPRADCVDVGVEYTAISVKDPDPKQKRQAGDTKWSFDASAGEFTAMTALRQLSTVYVDNFTDMETDIGNRVGWNGKYGSDSSCSGVGIYTPTLRLTCRRTVDAATAQSQSFIQTILAKQRRVNNTAFWGFSAGEVLFIGASVGEPYYNEEDVLLCDVSYQFAVRKNEESRYIGRLQFPAIYGWDYAWTITAFNPATSKDEPVVGCVSRVYYFADLTELGIGGRGS